MTGGMVATRRARTVLVPGIIWGFSEEYQSIISGESGDTVIMMVAIRSTPSVATRRKAKPKAKK